MNTCIDCIRYKDGYCSLLRQEKGAGDHCKLFETYEPPTPSTRQNKGVKSKTSIDWDSYLLEVTRTIFPAFVSESAEDASIKAITYAQALILKLKEELKRKK